MAHYLLFFLLRQCVCTKSSSVLLYCSSKLFGSLKMYDSVAYFACFQCAETKAQFGASGQPVSQMHML
jgi:hypothetical protein